MQSANNTPNTAATQSSESASSVQPAQLPAATSGALAPAPTPAPATVAPAAGPPPPLPSVFHIPAVQPNGLARFTCQEAGCGRTFSRNAALALHMSQIHKRTMS